VQIDNKRFISACQADFYRIVKTISAIYSKNFTDFLSGLREFLI